jgi:hypothetical protein
MKFSNDCTMAIAGLDLRHFMIAAGQYVGHPNDSAS